MSLPQLYELGEIDEDDYGPFLEEPLPPKPEWNPTPGVEQEAFIVWSVAMLDRMFEEQDLDNAMRELQSNDEGHRILREVMDHHLFVAACKLMPHLTKAVFEQYRYGPENRKARAPQKVGRKGNNKVTAALIDNKRLTEIWREHFEGRDRRPCAPSRLDILQKRHGLTEAERDTVEGYLFKRK